MGDPETDWKNERIQALKESLAFFSNAEKPNREKWVVRRLLQALHVNFKEEEMTGAQEPVDVAFRDAGFQVKELLDEGRGRTDEFKNKLEAAKSAKDYSELLEHYTPTHISFSEIVRRCFLYAETLLDVKGSEPFSDSTNVKTLTPCMIRRHIIGPYHCIQDRPRQF